MKYFDPPFEGSHYALDAYRVEDENHGPWEEMAYSFGAAAAFGLLGMAEAIRERHAGRCQEHDRPRDFYIGGGMTMCRACYERVTCATDSPSNPPEGT